LTHGAHTIEIRATKFGMITRSGESEVLRFDTTPSKGLFDV